MKLRDAQTFLSLYYEPNAVEIATGDAGLAASPEPWNGQTKELGQVATPDKIADFMAKWVMAPAPRTVLDPAAGLGGLLAACRRLNRKAELVGVERDAGTLQRAKTSAPRGSKLILADYLKSDAGCFDGIIANPPYVKAQRLDYSEKDWSYFEERLGTRLDRLTNLYALFLLKIWEDLSPRGRAAIIIPAEFLNANFGREIKERLVQVIRPAALVVFAPSVNLFADALTTSAIVFLEKGRLSKAHSWVKRADSLEDAEAFIDKISSGGTVSTGDGCLQLATLNPQEKWLNVLFNGSVGQDSVALPKRIGDYFSCRRGIATGANDFFCLSRSGMREHGLSQTHVEPCITKATDGDGLVFTSAKFDALIDRDRRCFLLNPSQNGPKLARYLELGEERGIHERHLPSHRPVWYLPENRAVADVWVAVFSRESVKFILNTSGAKNLTCFHGLYAKPGWESLPPLLTLFLNGSGGRLSFSKVNRFYGDGLNKLEPKDVEDMPCPEMPKLTPAQSAKLVQSMTELECLPLDERTRRIDELCTRYLIPGVQTAAPGAPPERRVQTRPPAGQQKRRAVPAS